MRLEVKMLYQIMLSNNHKDWVITDTHMGYLIEFTQMIVLNACSLSLPKTATVEFFPLNLLNVEIQ